MMYKRIGIAGFMGSGKSTCARLLANETFEVVDADAVAKTLMVSDQTLQVRLADTFGGSVIEHDAISFRELGRIAFGSLSDLVKLNAIVHPALVRRLHDLVSGSDGAHCILDAALIPLWGIEQWFDMCLWIDASFDTRLQRLKAKYRDQDASTLRNRMRLQEEVVHIPQRLPWIRLENEGSVEDLAAVVASMRQGEPRQAG
jgi:dephospho-CoA kinase